jgi:hypothetical protein
VPAVAFCPCPPALVPEVAAGAAGELAEVRQACDEAVLELVALATGPVLVVGPGPDGAPGRWHSRDAAGSLRGFGIDLRTGGPGEPTLPLSLTVGAWLLDRARQGDEPVPREYLQVSTTVDAAAPDQVAAIAAAAAVLVMGDGSARRAVNAPGALDPASEGFDAAVADALRAGDPAALAALDTAQGGRLFAAGTPAWALVGRALSPGWAGEGTLLADAAPYGVGYLVALWRS